MNMTNAESFAVACAALRAIPRLKRAGLRSATRFAAASSMEPTAPMAPPSVGVATPTKIVPSTRKISSNGGTITKITCSESGDRKGVPGMRFIRTLTAATMNASPTPMPRMRMM